MGKTIRLFMWAYQHVLRIGLGSLAKNVFAALDQDITPTAMLVGIRVPEALDGYPVCLEPEDEDWDPSIFSACAERAEQIYAEHPDHNLFYGDAPSMSEKPENIRKSSAKMAVMEILASYDVGHNTTSYCGMAVRVKNYHVVPVLQFSTECLALLPTIGANIKYGGFKASSSLCDSIIECILDETSRKLSEQTPGRFIHRHEPDITAILRKAASIFCFAVSLDSDSFLMSDIFDSLNTISSLRYEGGETKGKVIFSRGENPAVDLRLSFETPIPLSNASLARKIVEMSGKEIACITQGDLGLVGLGVMRPDMGKMFHAVFSGHYRWELYYGNTHLMTTAFGVPAFPSTRLGKETFWANIKRIMSTQPNVNFVQIWDCVSAAMEQGHGTMLVISEDAKAEAQRLTRQSLPITPVELTPDIVRRISGIDGAILIGVDCFCHAIGVILDGLATTDGDPARGARYNSAIRYVRSSSTDTLCIVVSEDGKVDMIPTLMPQISRIEVQRHVDMLSGQTHENYHKNRNWLDNHRFYLTQEQCDVVNTEMERISNEKREVGEILLTIASFKPHPIMDETYYLD